MTAIFQTLTLLSVTSSLAFVAGRPALGEPLRIATFNVDASPPIGSPVAYAPARSIVDPLSARGIVLLGSGRPVVLCVLDWIGIANAGHEEWRARLAEAAGTTADRVAVHAVHQHDGPWCDFTAEALLAAHGLGGKYCDVDFARETIARTAAALRAALPEAQSVTHLGIGKAKVEKVASNRRILGPDGKVKIIRWSRTTDPEAIAAPEGLIDPHVRLLSFWKEDQALACLSYYATHPQSYYGQGDVSADFVGLARAKREAELPGIIHIHFNGAGGNITAGKYNDGSEAMRPILAERLAEGMRQAWASTTRQPLSAADLEWRVRPVRLPVAEHLVAETLEQTLANPEADLKARRAAASDLAWLQRVTSGHAIDLSCLRLGSAYILHLPGELFIEYQLAAQSLKPNHTVCVAAYGDYAPGYLCTEIAYAQGGYESGPDASLVAPSVESVLTKAIREMLEAERAVERSP